VAERAVPFGDYQLEQLIGRGGMAEVWRARRRGPSGFARAMALKCILPAFAEEPRFVELFLAEARLCGRLSHPNVVSVYEAGVIDGRYFLAMELVHGRDLGALVRARAGALPAGLAATVIAEACRGLAYAHALTDDNGAPLGIVHRDVTPSNIMVDFTGTTRLLDFGIAKALAEGEGTRGGRVSGKLGYHAPEQLSGLSLDHRIDLFAAGVVLHEILTGRRLFPAAHAASAAASQRAEVELPSVRSPGIPAALDRICLRALARERDERYPSAAAMAADLDQVARDLGWNRARVASEMATLFPDEGLPAGATTLWRGDRPRRRRSLALPLALGAVALLVAVAAARVRFFAPAPPTAAPPTPAAPPTAAPPPTPVAPPILADAPPSPAPGAAVDHHVRGVAARRTGTRPLPVHVDPKAVIDPFAGDQGPAEKHPRVPHAAPSVRTPK
jgi:hypothetical protein